MSEDSFKGVFGTNQGSERFLDVRPTLAIRVRIFRGERATGRRNTRQQIWTNDASNVEMGANRGESSTGTSNKAFYDIFTIFTIYFELYFGSAKCVTS